MEMKEILNKITMKKVLLGKSTETAGNEYKVTLYKNKHSMTFHYHTSGVDPYLRERNKKDVVEALMMDNDVMRYMYPNYWTVDNFRREFGYNEEHKSDKELGKIMKLIEKESEGLARLFSSEELNILEKGVE